MEVVADVVIVVFAVGVALGAGPGFAVSFVDAALPEREGGDAGVSEGEVIGAVVSSRGIRSQRGDGVAELFGDGFYGGEESGALSSVGVELVALAEGKNLVEVEVEIELPDGHGRMLREIGGAEQALLLGGDGSEDDGVGRLYLGGGESAGHLHDHGGAGPVVACAVEDIVFARFGVGLDAEVVVVRGVDDGLVTSGLSAGKNPDDVGRLEAAHGADNGGVELHG